MSYESRITKYTIVGVSICYILLKFALKYRNGRLFACINLNVQKTTPGDFNLRSGKFTLGYKFGRWKNNF